MMTKSALSQSKWITVEQFYRLRGNTKIIVTKEHKYLKPNVLLQSDIAEHLSDEMMYFHLSSKGDPWNGFTDHMDQRRDYMIGLLLYSENKELVAQ